jgi:hypothetical protein
MSRGSQLTSKEQTHILHKCEVGPLSGWGRQTDSKEGDSHPTEMEIRTSEQGWADSKWGKPTTYAGAKED